jgi:16S rRNA (cytosine1402-N4)-methyltransferase
MSVTEYHVPVLLGEVLSLLVGDGDTVASSVNKKVYVDGTLGGGGHFRAVVGALSGRGEAGEYLVIGIDRDREALDNVRRAGFDRAGVQAILEQSRFSEFDSILREHGIDRVSGLLVDLGVSSRQIDAPGRGFMYMRDAPLDMRMDQSGGLTAAEFLERSGEDELALVFEKYGEIRNAGRMAGVIKDYMKHSKILTSADLKACLTREYGANIKIQALAKLFQALRIAVNGELEELRLFLDKSVHWLAAGGRIAVISYHSLEDRMVKEFFRAAEEACVCAPGLPVCTCNKPVLLKRVNRKAVMASDEEITRNPRSRSARLRVAERTEEVFL